MLYALIKEKESEMTIKSTLSITHRENLIKLASSPMYFIIKDYISLVHSSLLTFKLLFLPTSSLVARPTHTKPHGSGPGTSGISFEFKHSFELTH